MQSVISDSYDRTKYIYLASLHFKNHNEKRL